VPILLNVGMCGLHTVHNAFKAGAKAPGLCVEDIISSLYWLFTDSSARRQHFMDFTSSDLFSLKYCKHRWLENVPVARRDVAQCVQICEHNKGRQIVDHHPSLTR